MSYTWKPDVNETEKRVLNAIVELRDAIQDRVITHGISTDECVTCTKRIGAANKLANDIIEEYKA